MTGFVDVILRGLALVCASLALGGVAWVRLVLRAEPHAQPGPASRRARRVVAAWVGGLAHLVIYAACERSPGDSGAFITRRFSRVALVSVVALSLAGLGLTLGYVGDAGAFVGTAYGVMIVSKIVLFVVALAFASANFRMARRAAGPAGRLGRYVEVELGLAITVLFAAASLTSLPPAVDVREDRATVAEVAGRFV